MPDFCPSCGTPARSRTDAARDVLAERLRQITEEGWEPAYDDKHELGELAFAAACYAAHAGINCGEGRTIEPGGHASAIKAAVDFIRWGWPWAPKWWKPSRNRRRNLVKAGALILAEIERLDREAERNQEKKA